MAGHWTWCGPRSVISLQPPCLPAQHQRGSDLAAVNLTNSPGPPGQAGAGAGDHLVWSHQSHLTKHSTLLNLQTGLTVNVTEKDKIQF